MRIGELLRRTGVSARMIRYDEQHGRLQSHRTGSGHRQFTDQDVHRIQVLSSLLAAGVAPALAWRAIRHELSESETDEIRQDLTTSIRGARETENYLADRQVWI